MNALHTTSAYFGNFAIRHGQASLARFAGAADPARTRSVDDAVIVPVVPSVAGSHAFVYRAFTVFPTSLSALPVHYSSVSLPVPTRVSVTARTAQRGSIDVAQVLPPGRRPCLESSRFGTVLLSVLLTRLLQDSRDRVGTIYSSPANGRYRGKINIRKVND